MAEIVFDEHGCALCPLCPPSDSPYDWMKDDCGHRGLFVNYDLDVPLVENLEPAHPEDAVDGVWRVRCINGHVLLTSQDLVEDTGEGESYLAVPFRFALLAARWPVTKEARRGA